MERRRIDDSDGGIFAPTKAYLTHGESDKDVVNVISFHFFNAPQFLQKNIKLIDKYIKSNINVIFITN